MHIPHKCNIFVNHVHHACPPAQVLFTYGLVLFLATCVQRLQRRRATVEYINLLSDPCLKYIDGMFLVLFSNNLSKSLIALY